VEDDLTYVEMLEKTPDGKVSALRQLQDEYDAIFASLERLEEVYRHFRLDGLAYETTGISLTLVEMRRANERAKAEAKRELNESLKGA
jgi:hypothetical protein